MALILNTRYNDRQTTIITTNYADLPAAGGRPERSRARRARAHAGRPHRRPYVSRLAEMCIRVKMSGKDCRQNSIKRARFG